MHDGRFKIQNTIINFSSNLLFAKPRIFRSIVIFARRTTAEPFSIIPAGVHAIQGSADRRSPLNFL
jgi:hypothetical protein